MWEAAGFKTSGLRKEVFGKGAATDGIFMAWYYARYTSAEWRRPAKPNTRYRMFVNAALYGIGRGSQPLPSGGRPWDLVMDVWKAGGPAIDMLSPDAYSDKDFVRLRPVTPSPATRSSYLRIWAGRTARQGALCLRAP